MSTARPSCSLRSRAWLAVLGLLFSAGAGAADLEALLQQPVDAANVVLLVPHANDARVIMRWTAALGAPQSVVRFAAARALAVVGARGAREALVTALAAEQEPRVARELAWALMVVAGTDADGPLRAALERLGKNAAPGFAALLAEGRGAGIVAFLPALRAAGLGSGAMAGLLPSVVTRDPHALTPFASAALRERDAVLWGAALRAATRTNPVDPGPLAVSLGETPAIRDATLLYLAATLAPETPPAPALQQALDTLRAAFAGGATAPFAWELLERALGRAPRENPDALRQLGDAATADGEMRAWLLRKPLLRRLTPSELKAFDGVTRGAARALLKSRDWPEPSSPPASPTGRLILATVRDLPADLVRDVLRATGCRPADDALALATAEYGHDGRAHEMRGVDPGLSQGCLEAALPLLALGRGHPGVRGQGRSLAVLPLSDEALACRDDAEASAAQPHDDAGEPRDGAVIYGVIQEPRKVRRVEPVYPDAARSARIQGLVILKAAISPTGCVDDLMVVRGVIPPLDLAALRAVLRWRYSPTLLKGVPVPISMTVNVNFKLN